MAVTFKVPASPKKDIFVIDEFMGVDLTNTGSNIDETKSPNAENMVRYVPGKVRKRMGYSVPVEFSKGEDVNRAVESSEDLITLEFDENGYVNFPIYDAKIDTAYFRFHWEVVGTYTIYLDNNNNTHWSWQDTGTEEEPLDETRAVYARDCSAYGGMKRVRIHHDSDGETDYCKVSQMFICHATNIESGQWWHSVDQWKAAPEDKGNSFVLSANNEPVYGHYSLRTGKKQGDFVTDVNRALNTSNVYHTFPDHIVCELGEMIPKGKSVFISFRYINNTGSAQSLWATNQHTYYNVGDLITTIPSGFGYVGLNYTFGQSATLISIADTSVELNSFFITYKVGHNDYSPAPEDNGGSFDVSNVYQKVGSNTALFTSYAEGQLVVGGSARNSGTATITIQQATTGVIGELTGVEFDLSYTVDVLNSGGTLDHTATITKYDLTMYDSNDASVGGYTEITESPNHVHFSMRGLPDDGEFIKTIQIDFTINETTTKSLRANINIDNLKVYKLVELTDFWSAAYINLYHVGQKLYENKSGKDEYNLIYSNMNQQRSMSWQFEARDNDSELLGHDNLYIVDGRTYLEYDGATGTIMPVNGNGRIPLVTYAKQPSGGGESQYAINRLQPGFEEQFIGDGTSTNYQLSFSNLDLTPVRVWIKDQNDGSWVEHEEGTDFTVNYGLGVVFFTTAPWDNRQGGEDNVKIRAFRTIQRYEESINKCSFGTLFGVGGTSDRIFLSGNPDTPNYDYYSERYDPTYFPDVNYATLGVSASSIKGYARVNNYLATFKDENEPSQSVFIREGDMVVDENNNSNPAFKLINTLQGNGAISPYTFGYLQTEPLFLTKSGIYAITAQDITGEKYGQSRSFYLNGALLKEVNLEDACAIVYNDQYILSINNRLYVLDGLQPIRTDPQMPYATRQYVGFYCTGIPATVLWTYNDSLWFGTQSGKVCKFHTDTESLDSYNDDGKAIYCCWETPDLDGKLFYKNKTFRYFAIRMMKALRTSVKLYSQKLGSWSFIKEDTSSGVVFDFDSIDFTNFSFSTDSSEKVVHTKVRVKKVDKARFRVENGNKNEPFGLFDLALEYIESGNYKG